MDGIVLLRDEFEYLRRIAHGPAEVPHPQTISEELILEHLASFGLVEQDGEEFRPTALGLSAARQPLESPRRPVVRIPIPVLPVRGPHFVSRAVGEREGERLKAEGGR